MAVINERGNIIAHCPTCDGAKSTFEYVGSRGEIGHVTKVFPRDYRHFSDDQLRIRFQLFRCTACGAGALGVIKIMNVHGSYPEDIWQLLDFYPEAKERLRLPKEVPIGIQREFREAELCSEAGCYRAAAGMLRSVLDKTLRANGYNTRDNKNLKQQIDAAAGDGVITKSRQKRAHEEVRVFGNDVLHDDWHETKEEDINISRQYLQRLLEDSYDDRPSVLALLKAAQRMPDELKPKTEKAAQKKEND
jgi:hypothetical protein